ncbi:suppressor of fused domain protein [Fluviicola chungangensis]|uniref:Suppressor of fused domain protein n=1 Tax=Fluviicola chungangensis TaxID=2597671 RepID=A0A556N2H2_9FLAO|nr:suppressor of fused domain protein [Fluviicola chungangensis]TSJ46283.1 suppressor of fused domain protein [Fluviicola chungangensis]
MELLKAFENRFGAHRVKSIQNPLHNEQELMILFLELDVPVTVIMTASLSDYKMPVLEKWVGREFNEIFFCLPAYWDFEDYTNPNCSWIYSWLYKLERFVRDKNTWFGPGHTIPTGNPEVPISNLMKQEYFIFLDPILLQKELSPVIISGKTIQFLSIVPIFGDELDFKMGKGTQKFIRRFIQRNQDEKLDDYRSSILNSRLRFF